MSRVRSIEELNDLYGTPLEAATVKEVARITPAYRRYIEASPFVALSTCGPEGLDCSPRGDQPGFVRIADERTLMMPDRRGNNRIDSLRNIIRDPHVALLFLVPGISNTLRVNGRAHLSIDSKLRDSFKVEGGIPRSVLVIEIDVIYFQCARAILRSGLWTPTTFRDASELPSAGDMLAEITEGRVGGETYDREWPERARKTLW